MRADYLLNSPQALELYNGVKALPICDYHCHLSPKEIYEDKEFGCIGEMWLSGDHYKWRLMRQAGIDESLITGSAPWPDKFKAYASVVSMSGGNPLFAWSKMELAIYFGIEDELNEKTADHIYQRANALIKTKGLSPRKLIEGSLVEYIATTDDPADDLQWHRLLSEDKSFTVRVVPSFRTDRLLSIEHPEYPAYIRSLARAAATEITDIGDLRIALKQRLDVFNALGCRFSDLGIESFPKRLCSREEAAPVFSKALEGHSLSKEEQGLFRGYLYRFLAREYAKRGMTMQLHLAARRDVNTRLTVECGRDAGSDCVGDPIPGSRIMNLLNSLHLENHLPKTIVYTLNPQMNSQLAPACASFPGVVQGAAWWYCDHKRGITELLETMAETSYIGKFPGMLTDSRSFLSYARHDYFRRILCSLLAKWVLEDDFPVESAQKLAADLSYNNIRDYI